jgi:SPP1 gp7 family putative phage head morphogenesis protein
VRDYMDVPQKDEPYTGRSSIASSTAYAEKEKPLAAAPAHEIIESFPYRDLTLAEKKSRVNYQELGDQFLQRSNKISNVVESELHTQLGKMMPTIKGIYAGKNLQATRNLKFNVGNIRTEILQVFIETYLEAKLQGLQEIENMREERLTFGEKLNDLIKFQQPPKPEEMILKFKGRVPMTKEEWKQLLPRMRSRAFTVAGQIHKDIVAEIQELIYRAFDEDWTMDELLAAVEKKSIAYTGKAWNYPPDTPMKPWHTELIFRNALSTIYNDARRKLFNHPDVRKYIPAYQYSAILDTRTRDTHRAMDGRIYPRNDPIWKEWWPPSGHNCRCTIIPVTSNVPYTVSPSTDLKPDEGFGKP